MAKAKKPTASDAGATKKQATETKKAASESKAPAAAKTTKAAATTTKASAMTTKSAASADQSAAGGAATKKKAPAKQSTGGTSVPSSMPLIDTSLAAETAAKFVVNRAMLGNAGSGAGAGSPQDQADDEAGAEKRETSAFKQLKAGLNKPSLQGPGGILGGAGANKKGNSPFGGGNQQVGRNQTFGADVNRSGVPRRTGG
jgi:hypothetical protein